MFGVECWRFLPLPSALAFRAVASIIPADVGNVLRQPWRSRFTTKRSFSAPSFVGLVSSLDWCEPPLLANGFPRLRGGVSFGAADCLPVSAPLAEEEHDWFADQGLCPAKKRDAPPI